MNPRAIDLVSLSDDEARPLHDFYNAVRAEQLPDDPPIPFEERLIGWRNPSPKGQFYTFVVSKGAEIVGAAGVGWEKEDENNPHLGGFDVDVSPSHRRQGIGRALLQSVLEVSRDAGKTKLFTGTADRVPAGHAFAEWIGAKLGLEEHTNQLLFTELNRDFMEASIREAPSDLFEIGWYEGEYPEADLEAICNLFEVMNTAPRGDLEFNDWKVKPEDLRIESEQMQKRGIQWWMLYAKERSSGRFAGYTQTGFHPNRPHVVNQWGTGVIPEYRGHNIGAWLKSVMIERILNERPTVDRIRTGNADSNAPMLRINHTLGFKPFMARADWQLDVNAALEKLEAMKVVAV